MKIIRDKDLNNLIRGLKGYKEKGVIDPWLMSDGTTIEPLDVLRELRVIREMAKPRHPDGKINPEDQGPLLAAMYIERGRLVINFGKSLTWLALGKESLRVFIDRLESQYNKMNNGQPKST